MAYVSTPAVDPVHRYFYRKLMAARRYMGGVRMTRHRSKPGSKQRRKMALWLPRSLLMVMICVPGLWVVLSAFRPNREILAKPPVWIPQELTLVNFGKIFGFGAEQVGIPVGSYFLNSLIISLTSTVIALIDRHGGRLCLCALSLSGKGGILSGPDADSHRAGHCAVAAALHDVEHGWASSTPSSG